MIRTAAGLLVLSAALAGCSSSPAKPVQSGFDAASQPGCMRHQQHGPTSVDTRTPPDIARVLTVLRYYGEMGAEPFCDAKPASATDLSWMRYYVAQGADPTKGSRWLGHP